jgi:Spy/CpxP family protein refolding chaperone
MKPFLALAVLAAALSQPVLAEGQGPGPRADRMVEELQLNEEQAAKVREIMKEQHAKHRAVLDESRDDREQLRAKRDALHQETRAKLAKVLDEDQMTRFDEMHKERRATKGERRKGRMEFLDELDLSDEQKSQVRQIMDEQRDKRRAIWEGGGDRDQNRSKMQALHEETKKRLSTVLNEEQLAKFEQAKQKRGQKHHEPKGERRRDGTGKDVEKETGAKSTAPQQD